MSWLALALVVVYLGVVGYFYVAQRDLLFIHDATEVDPALAGLPDAVAHRLRASDGTELVAWSLAGRGPVTVIYFHGNGGSLAGRGAKIQALHDLGLSVLAIDYRGYGGSGGQPSETGFAADADAAYDALRQQNVPPERILLFGESLGTGVAVSLAARRPVAGVILDAPFSSIVDIAADRYPLLPVRWLLRDPFHSDRTIGRVEAPILILHGDQDAVVPIRYGRRLLSFAGPRTRFVTIAGGAHTVLQDERARAVMAAWITEMLPSAAFERTRSSRGPRSRC